ncbi:hypothetical protein LQU85_05290 [Actinobacillus pleuropneumoniae]|uniref:hypothetical protein n=3 Tax=Pasteurellales TaxID=135625 RepID=UPI000585AA5F|nr:hypothetical protein [Actinobacillus pleuropneumoniae]NNI12907.1 hypothetical protein [Pasteurella multocida]WEG85499.1 mobilization protein [Glaesserella parasuis]KIE87611.1 putative MobC [Actinobacillus pleuropneumoniae]MCL7725339.1 hypothetical protein [Actinobacillus pleuropneumoniae]MCL7737834.1 hypothetical protein [Actinobacillus pleuropneumoniae]
MLTMSLTRLEQKQAELEKKRAEIKAKIRSIRSKEQAEKRKKSTHYKVLLGAYALHSFVERGEFPLVSAEQLRKFINDDKKFDELSAFINEEIAKGKK